MCIFRSETYTHYVIVVLIITCTNFLLFLLLCLYFTYYLVSYQSSITNTTAITSMINITTNNIVP